MDVWPVPAGCRRDANAAIGEEVEHRTLHAAFGQSYAQRIGHQKGCKGAGVPGGKTKNAGWEAGVVVV
jgi:hypothetical protein